ncbi:hypothetical protein [Desulfohalovibrio reitneri]|uniref:hypothetical protein n=1 Tax=Desulfohalovibrio reitneri TaxID=1307759 RepID=UPI0004A70B02|nr:hypothetical protein [Desulfohalovibrio reitneri]
MPPTDPETPRGTVPTGPLEGMTDAELPKAVLDKIIADGRVEVRDLRIEARDGKLLLEGSLPSNRGLAVLRQLLEDTLDLEIVDNAIRIDPTAWQRRENAPGLEVEETDEEQELLYGEKTDEETFDGVEDGTTVAPSDEFIPEGEDWEDIS